MSLVMATSSAIIIPDADAQSILARPPTTTIVHVQDPSLCDSNASAPIRQLVAKYTDGSRIPPDGKVIQGTQLEIEAILSAECYRTQNEDGLYQFTALIEVRDSDGITRYLAVQQGDIQPWTESSYSISWIPEEPGEYEIRAFSLGDLHSTSVLSQVVIIKITVV